MKHLIVLTIALFAGIANATQPFRPTEPIIAIAKVDQVSTKVQSVSLFEDGSLIAYGRDGKLKQLKLAPIVRGGMIGLAQSIGQAEIITTHSTVVCMMMFNPFMQRELSVLSSAGMRLSLSAQSCAVSDHTHPKEDYVMSMATKLRDQMILLSQQLLRE